MVRSKKRLTIVIASVVAALILIVGLIWVIANPYNSTDISNDKDNSASAGTNKPSNDSSGKDDTEKPADTTPTKPETPAPDPSTVKSFTIDQFGLVLSYDRTLPGLNYEIKRTGAGTEYVSLMFDGLIGDKCTGDEGEFASIIKNPTNADSIALSGTIKLGNDVYGLDLPDAACTNNAELLTKFQDSMKANFPYMTLADSQP